MKMDIIYAYFYYLLVLTILDLTIFSNENWDLKIKMAFSPNMLKQILNHQQEKF